MLKSIEQGKLLAARYLPSCELGDIIPLLLPNTHVQHAVRRSHSSLSKRHRLHADVGDALQPFAARWIVSGRVSTTANLLANASDERTLA
jgi:hypothetical protein